jgi:hypothetical protein
MDCKGSVNPPSAVALWLGFMVDVSEISVPSWLML